LKLHEAQKKSRWARFIALPSGSLDRTSLFAGQATCLSDKFTYGGAP
jgi:hypothetical protein